MSISPGRQGMEHPDFYSGCLKLNSKKYVLLKIFLRASVNKMKKVSLAKRIIKHKNWKKMLKTGKIHIDFFSVIKVWV